MVRELVSKIKVIHIKEKKMDLRKFIANKTYWYMIEMQIQHQPKEDNTSQHLPPLEHFLANYRIFINNHISKAKIKDLYSEEQKQELIREFEEIVKQEYKTFKHD